jgi:hypothetical protein
MKRICAAVFATVGFMMRFAQADDFSRDNPIHRWWGGTELTNDRLWRWDPDSRALIAP